MQQNLDNLIYDAKYGKIENTCLKLSDGQIMDIFEMVAKGCRSKTKERIYSRLQVPLSLWKRYGIYSRMTLTDNGAEYICGQSWTDEMRTLRECILEN